MPKQDTSTKKGRKRIERRAAKEKESLPKDMPKEQKDEVLTKNEKNAEHKAAHQSE